MIPIATYVFIDIETTGLPSEEVNRTKITELSLVAVKRDHVLDTRPGASPRVQHKLTLCFNPWRMIQPSCSEVTGLCNDLLENEPKFDEKVFGLIENFLSVLSKPVCLIAQNGLNFDFPILKNHFEKLSKVLPDDVQCADCFHGFYDILEKRKKDYVKEIYPKENGQNDSTSVDVGKTDITDTPKKDEVDEPDLSAPNTLPMQAVNETTPHQKKIRPLRDESKISKARRRFPWSGSNTKPTEKYKLKHIYERVLNRPCPEAHRAENDCIIALECSVALSKEFVEWVDENHVPFSIIKPMTIGVRLGN